MDRYAALTDVCNAPGGEVLLDALLEDVVNSVNTLASRHHELTHSEFIAQSARMATNLNLVRSLTRAGQNLEGAEELLKLTLRE